MGFKVMPFPILFLLLQGASKPSASRDFLLQKDEIANPCNFSVLKKDRAGKKVGRRRGGEQRRKQSELSFWPNITFLSGESQLGE